MPVCEVSDLLVLEPGVDVQQQVRDYLNEWKGCEYNKTRQKLETNAFEIQMGQEEMLQARHVYVHDRELPTRIQDRSA